MLRKSWQFRFVYDHGRKAVGEHLVLFFCSPPDEFADQDPRVSGGVVASKRVGSAVRRNRAKRLLRNATRIAAGNMNDRNIWIVAIARASINDKKAGDVENDLRRTLDTAGLLGRQ